MNKLQLFTCFIFLALSNNLSAKGNERDAVKEQQIEKQLESIDPNAVEFFKAGTKAMDEQNLVLSDSLYTIVYQKVPTFDPLLRRLGIIRVQLGKSEEGIELCKKAVSINRSAYNLLSLANCYYYSSNGESSSYNSKAINLIKEAEMLPNGDEYEFPALLAQISLQENNIVEFKLATKKLVSKFPNEIVTHYYAAIMAVVDEDWIKAKSEILTAGKLGLPQENVEKFLDSGVRNKARMKSATHSFLFLSLLWVVGLFALFALGKLLSNFTIKSLEKTSATNGLENKIRSIYRWIINIGGVYYYISLPIILILIIVIVVGLFYAFILIGRIPVQLMLVLAIGSGITIYSMIRSLLVKIKYSDPGRELKEEEAPSLFKLTKEVAEAIGTRPIDEIRITPTTDLAVYERGTWREKLQDKAQRVLIVGAGVLKDFKQDDFKAVLAHEYGHFSNRDTAGGEVALRVRGDMDKYFYALYTAGQNVWWNVAFQFLRLYNLIFVRISHGSTRLQEVLADRVAARTYGVVAFQNGLTHVIRREFEFNKFANQEIEEARKSKRPFYNLYNLSGNVDKTTEEEINNVLTRKTTDADTHPSPTDRFRYIKDIRTSDNINNSSYVSELFKDWNGLTEELTLFVEKKLNE